MQPGDARAALISALEHFSYCPRQCALIHIDQSFDENIYTLRGRLAHRAVDQPQARSARGVRVVHSLPLWCERLGLRGTADVVEFRRSVPYPVEHKIGRLKRDRHADLQLCAQALCLEEMTGREVPAGAVYHISSRRRREVEFTSDMREATERTVEQVRSMLARPELPLPTNDRRCLRCSLRESCLPAISGKAGKAQRALRSIFRDP